MSQDTRNIKCPACGAPMRFSAEQQCMVCDFCDTLLALDAPEIQKQDSPGKPGEVESTGNTDGAAAQTEGWTSAAPTVEKEPIDQGGKSADAPWHIADIAADWDGSDSGLGMLSCSSCGASLMADSSRLAGQCPWCGSYTLAEGRIQGGQRPELVLPFQISKEKAIKNMNEWFKTRKLLPKTFMEEHHLEEVHGIYVPYYLFDASTESEAHFIAVERGTSARRGDNIYTTVREYECYRRGVIHFSRIPQDASAGISDSMMQSLEPFQYDRLKAFVPAALSGFEAEVKTVAVEPCAEQAEKRILNTADKTMKAQIGKRAVTQTRTLNHKLKREKAAYALLPVWLLTTRYRGECYYFAVNGQSGKMAGDTPVGKKETRLFWLKGILKPALISAGVLYALAFLAYIL